MKPCALTNFGAAFAAIATPVDPREFIRPDGSYSATELNKADPDDVEKIREQIRNKRRATAGEGGAA